MSRLNGVDPAGGVETVLYAPAAAIRATIWVSCCNRNAAIAKVRATCRAGAGPTNSTDWLARDEAIPANDSRVSKVFDVDYPQTITVESDIGGVTFQANGIERPT